MHTSVNRLSTNLHSQGVGNERTAQAVVQLQGAVKGVYEGVISHTKKEPVAATALRGSTAMLDNCEDQLELATINELEVGNVRDVAKKAMINEMLGAKESYRAMPNRVRALEILYDACLAVRGASQDEAVAYLSSQRVFLTTAGSPTEKRIRVSEKLYRISSHVVEALQKVAMVAYFKSLGESIEAMTPATAEAWLRNNKYAHSATADSAINAALKAMLRRNGHHARVVTPKEVGDGEYVDATVGHVGLIAHWARGVFEKVAGVRKARRTGNDDGAYDGWRAEVRNVSTLLPWHGAVAGGLRLTDGIEEHRAMNVADDGTYVIECSEDEELPEGSAGSSGQQWDSSQELMPGRGPVSSFAGVDDGLLGDDVFEGEGDVGGGDGAVGAEREEVAEALGVADGAEVDEEWEGVEGEKGADGWEGVDDEEGAGGGEGVNGTDAAATTVAGDAAEVGYSPAGDAPAAGLPVVAGDPAVDGIVAEEGIVADAATADAAACGADADGVGDEVDNAYAAAGLDAAAGNESAGATDDAAGAEAAARDIATAGAEAPARAEPVDGADGDQLSVPPPGLLPESLAYPDGFAEYLEEVPL